MSDFDIHSQGEWVHSVIMMANDCLPLNGVARSSGVFRAGKEERLCLTVTQGCTSLQVSPGLNCQFSTLLFLTFGICMYFTRVCWLISEEPLECGKLGSYISALVTTLGKSRANSFCLLLMSKLYDRTSSCSQAHSIIRLGS